MTYRILRKSSVGLRPVQNYLHENGKPIAFSNYMAASIEIARLKKSMPEALRRRVQFEVVPTKH